MPEKCLSCGECAVIEHDIEGSCEQRICIECGTVASGVKTEIVCDTGQVKIELYPFVVVKHESLICLSCGDSLTDILQSDVKICPECQGLQSSDDVDDSEGVMTSQSETQLESQNSSELASSVKTCKSCNSTNLSLDIIGADERLVCKDCGTVAESETLMNDEFEIMSRPYRNNYFTLPAHARQPRKLRGRAAGHERIAFLQNKLCFSQFIKEESLELFDKVFDKPQVFNTHITTKEHVAAACVFIVFRQHDIPVSLLHFRKYVDKFNIFLKGRKIVLKCMDICLPHMTLSCQVEHLLDNYGFGTSLISKVNDILFLCRQAWLTQGRSREGLIIIATYYAYVSSDKCTGFVSMNKFRRMFKFPTISLNVQAECNNMFLKLASSIPWVPTKKVKLATVYKYIDDILKYQNSLFQLAFRSQDDSSMMCKNVPEIDKELDGKTNQKSAQKTQNKHATKRNSCDAFQKDILLPSASKRNKRQVLMPESRILSEVDLDSPILVESEFDEEEIASYLFSPEEEEQMRTPKLNLMR